MVRSANGATTFMFESIPTVPQSPAAIGTWSSGTGITLFYTAPTAIRALAAYGEEPVKARYDRS